MGSGDEREFINKNIDRALNKTRERLWVGVLGRPVKAGQMAHCMHATAGLVLGKCFSGKMLSWCPQPFED